MKAFLRRYGFISLLLFLTIIVCVNMYVGVFEFISVRSSEQDVYGTKLDRIKEAVDVLGESYGVIKYRK